MLFAGLLAFFFLRHLDLILSEKNIYYSFFVFFHLLIHPRDQLPRFVQSAVY